MTKKFEINYTWEKWKMKITSLFVWWIKLISSQYSIYRVNCMILMPVNIAEGIFYKMLTLFCCRLLWLQPPLPVITATFSHLSHNLSSLCGWLPIRVQWFFLFFTFWGITPHPWHPKGPRIWKLAKKNF